MEGKPRRAMTEVFENKVIRHQLKQIWSKIVRIMFTKRDNCYRSANSRHNWECSLNLEREV
jgi:hypothetical protein